MSTTAQPPALAAELDLIAPQAITIAGIPDVGVRRHQAQLAVAERRHQLATYRAVYREVYGRELSEASVKGGDELLTELLVLTVA